MYVRARVRARVCMCVRICACTRVRVLKMFPYFIPLGCESAYVFSYMYKYIAVILYICVTCAYALVYTHLCVLMNCYK